jgi:putative methionine-R-sulfoxide reductase with GAF domain
MTNYLQQIGLPELADAWSSAKLNQFVSEDLALELPAKFGAPEVASLFTYPVPQLAPSGACAAGRDPAKEPYDLRQTYGLATSFEELVAHPKTLYLWRLGQIVSALQALTEVDWLGVYKKIPKNSSEHVLIKEAYVGAFSRAEFPLTAEFAKNSNNTTVALTKKAVVVEDVAEYAGPYYQCDAQVKSEFCLPIVTERGEVLGIIDAESFTPRFFTPERILEISKVAADLANSGKF